MYIKRASNYIKYYTKVIAESDPICRNRIAEVEIIIQAWKVSQNLNKSKDSSN